MQPNLNEESKLDCLITRYRKHESSIVLKKTMFSRHGRTPVVHSQCSECMPTTEQFERLPIYALENEKSKLLILCYCQFFLHILFRELLWAEPTCFSLTELSSTMFSYLKSASMHLPSTKCFGLELQIWIYTWKGKYFNSLEPLLILCWKNRNRFTWHSV